MASKVVSGRVPEELAAWLDEYAASRGAKRGEVIAAALRSLREGSEGAVSGLPRAGRIQAAAESHASLMMARQVRLNRELGR